MTPSADRKDDRVRLWLRLLATTNQMEGRLRARLAERFATTMPRFDAMAQLARSPDGMTLTELSRRMMVTKGNISGLVERLVADGLVERRAVPGDRRSALIRLSPLGQERFLDMAPVMENWIEDLLACLDDHDSAVLGHILGRIRTALR